MAKRDATKIIRQIINNSEIQSPSEISIAIHLMKWQEAHLYPDEGLYEETAHDLIVSQSLEHFRRQIILIGQSITDYFEENDIDDTDEFTIDILSTSTEFTLDVEFFEEYVRDFLLTPRVMTFYSYYIEQLKNHQATLLLRGVFSRGFDEQNDAREFLYSDFSYDQREYLLYWSGIIGDELRSKMARIRSRRNRLIHSLDPGYSSAVKNAIDDLDLCIEVMQEVCEMDNRRTALGRLDSIVEGYNDKSTSN